MMELPGYLILKQIYESANSILKQLFPNNDGKINQLSLPQFLKIAIKTTEILGEIHTSNVIHKDINPA